MAKVAERVTRKRPSDVAEFRATLRKGRWRPFRYATLLGLRSSDPTELHERIQQGLSYRALERFQRNVDLPLLQIAELVQIAPRTLSRRKEEGRLQPDESDRLLRASRLVGRALELFEGDLETARKWLSTPLRSLRGKAPLELIKTEVGAQEVEALIGRLEHGIIS